MQRQDYILRLIEQLGLFFRQVTQLRQTRRHDEALMELVRAQETLFGRGTGEFSAWSIDQQFDHLVAGEPPTRAAEKAAVYAALLRTAAQVYRDREQEALEQGAGLLADSIEAMAAGRFPTEAEAAFRRVSAQRETGSAG